MTTLDSDVLGDGSALLHLHNKLSPLPPYLGTIMSFPFYFSFPIQLQNRSSCLRMTHTLSNVYIQVRPEVKIHARGDQGLGALATLLALIWWLTTIQSQGIWYLFLASTGVIHMWCTENIRIKVKFLKIHARKLAWQHKHGLTTGETQLEGSGSSPVQLQPEFHGKVSLEYIGRTCLQINEWMDLPVKS